MVVQFELENLELKLDPEPVLTDLIHAVSIFCLSQQGLTQWLVTSLISLAKTKELFLIKPGTLYLLFKANDT